MNLESLLLQSKKDFDRRPDQVQDINLSNIFLVGSEWMFGRLNQHMTDFDHSLKYWKYGMFKYGVSLLMFSLSFVILVSYHWALSLVSILVFYLIEVHFLFLFPLLLDKVKNPILTSVQLTYRIGMFRATYLVMRIGMFMVYGFLNVNNPLKNWYVGCLSIVIWYKDEARSRL